MLLVFSYEHSKPKAFVPLAWAGAVLAGMAAETLVTAGIKAGNKALLKHQAKKHSADLADKGHFDFLGTNPYRNKDGSITLSPSANDRAKMAGLISGALLGSMVGPDGEKSCPQGINGSSVPLYNPYDVSDNSQYPYYMEEQNRINVSKDMVYNQLFIDSNGEKFVRFYNKYNGKFVYSYKIPLGENISHFRVMNSGINALDEGTVLYLPYVNDSQDGFAYRALNEFRITIPSISKTMLTNSNNIAKTVDAEIINCEGIYIPSTLDRIYQPPMDMTSTYKMPNHEQLKDKPLIIQNIFAPGSTEGEITWEEIEEYLQENGKNFDEIMDGNIENYLEKGDINNYSYTIDEINNIYTDIGQTEKVEDFEPPTGEPDLPVPNPDGDGNLPVPVEPIDKSLLVIAKESYQYLADTVKNSVEGLTAVTAGATGLITFLGTTMGWLPNEWIVMFSAAFGLGLFAFFFRR